MATIFSSSEKIDEIIFYNFKKRFLNSKDVCESKIVHGS